MGKYITSLQIQCVNRKKPLSSLLSAPLLLWLTNSQFHTTYAHTYNEDWRHGVQDIRQHNKNTHKFVEEYNKLFGNFTIP